jgi:hypothetical protein
MSGYTAEVFDSAGTLAISRADHPGDILHVTNVSALSEPSQPITDEEHQLLIDRIVLGVKLPEIIERLKAVASYDAGEAERITREDLDIDTADEGAYSIESDTAESYHAGRAEAMYQAIDLLLGKEVSFYSETEASA